MAAAFVLVGIGVPFSLGTKLAAAVNLRSGTETFIEATVFVYYFYCCHCFCLD